MRFCFHLLPRLVLAGLALLLIEASPTRAAERPPQDAGSGELLLRGSVKAAYLNADTLRPTRVPASIFEEDKL